MRVLYVCTANICRSASAARLLRTAAADESLLAGLQVRSAGTAAVAGMPGCRLAPSLAGHAEQHRSQPLTEDLIEWADLILPAARDHREVILRWVPSARSCTFTVRQVGRIAEWMRENHMVDAARDRAERDQAVRDRAIRDRAAQDRGAGQAPREDEWRGRFPPGDPRAAVAPLPGPGPERWAWLVSELDAARGMAPAPIDLPEDGAALPERARGPRWLPRFGRTARNPSGSRDAPTATHPDDVPDPHVLGMEFHAISDAQIRAATASLVALLAEVAR